MSAETTYTVRTMEYPGATVRVHIPLLIHAVKDSQINIPNLPQPDYLNCLDGSFSLG